MKKNRILGLVMAALLTVTAFGGCGAKTAADSGQKGGSAPENGADSAKYSIVCTTFPQYDWVRNIIGDKADEFELTMLLDQGTDLHSYQPTAEDIAKIADADMFVYVGGESDSWVDDALKETENVDMRVVNLLESLGDSVREEEVIPGMQAEEENEELLDRKDSADEERKAGSEAEGNSKAVADEENEDDEDEPEYDEHVWLSLKNAAVLTEVLAENIQALDSVNKFVYAENTAEYTKKLDDLDGRYALTVSEGKRQVVLFGDRFPFRYMVDDYGLTYYAAFVGCSAETEASFETVTFLAQKVDELALPVILTIEGSDQKVAEAVKNATESKNQEILAMDSMQSVTANDVADGETYMNVMEKNLNTLSQALN